MKIFNGLLALALVVAVAGNSFAVDYCTVSSGGHTYVFVAKGSVAILQGTGLDVANGGLGTGGTVDGAAGTGGMPAAVNPGTTISVPTGNSVTLASLQPFNTKVKAIVATISAGSPLTPAQQAYYSNAAAPQSNSVSVVVAPSPTANNSFNVLTGLNATATVTSGNTTVTVGAGSSASLSNSGLTLTAGTGTVGAAGSTLKQLTPGTVVTLASTTGTLSSNPPGTTKGKTPAPVTITAEGTNANATTTLTSQSTLNQVKTAVSGSAP